MTDAPAQKRDPASLHDWVSTEARAMGFDAVGIARADAASSAGDRLLEFIAEGRHGTMDWMETHADRRCSPKTLWPDARSIVMVGRSYAPDQNPLDALAEKRRGAISAYAKGRDYHDVLKKQLKTFASRLATAAAADVKVFVDTAPLMEKPHAQSAGLGWQGKHTNLVSREHGSWLFLGAILTTADISPDTAEQDHCGSCRRCLDICPTDAFPAPYQLDARRCIAYLTIEHKGHIDPSFRKAIGNRIFGCDDCLAVCPWNKFAAESREARFKATAATANPPLADLLTLDDPSFRTAYAGTPIKRTGRERFVRNCLIAAGNSGDASLIPIVTNLLSDGSPLVRAMAVWALAELAPETLARHEATHFDAEPDEDVRREWVLAHDATRQRTLPA